MLKCILDVGTGTGDVRNVAVGLHDLFQKDTMDSFTVLCRELVSYRWDGVSNMSIHLVFVHSGYLFCGWRS